MSHSVTDSTVLLGHGSGGQMMKRIIDEVFLDAFGSPELLEGNDAGVAALPVSGRIAMSTDSFVVSPQFFPGGNIGRLAVCGTVNDVATSGANVRYLSCGFILEEGYPMEKLRQIVQTMAETAREAGVAIITGDTKVVECGGADGVYINTAGVGEVPAGVALSGANCQPGDVILVSGTLGDHGIAIMSQREGLAFSSTIESDAAPLNRLIADVLAAAPDARCFRDPTRGGLASTLNEFAQASGTGILGLRLLCGLCSLAGFRILCCTLPAFFRRCSLLSFFSSAFRTTVNGIHLQTDLCFLFLLETPGLFFHISRMDLHGESTTFHQNLLQNLQDFPFHTVI